jgi:MFS-type transporter involved in bile tolerance (Atg22 family)
MTRAQARLVVGGWQFGLGHDRAKVRVGGLFVAFVCYLILWFIARNMVDGAGAAVDVGWHALVIALSLGAGYSSFRSTLRRR